MHRWKAAAMTTSARSVNPYAKSQNSGVYPRICRISMRNISRSLKVFNPTRQSFTWFISVSSAVCNCWRSLMAARASTSRTTGNRLEYCMRKKSSHKKLLTPSSLASASRTSGCSSLASSSGQFGRSKSWPRNSLKCNKAVSGLGE